MNDGKFWEFHKMFRQLDISEDPNIDNFIYDVIGGELYLPYRDRNFNSDLGNQKRAEYFCTWFENYTTNAVTNAVEKTINFYWKSGKN